MVLDLSPGGLMFPFHQASANLNAFKCIIISLSSGEYDQWS